MEKQPDFDTIKYAYSRIRPHIHRTPILTNSTINTLLDAHIFFKCENFQKVGAFKFRGACNAVFSLSEEEAVAGVITHSSGNHAAALSLAAKMRGLSARIVMPSNAPRVKIAAVENYGGKITYCEPTLKSRENTTAQIIDETGATLVHPFNDYRIIAGQATAALEFLENVQNLDYILVPVGGGGLLSGTALISKSLNPEIKVIGCEPQNADDAYRSVKAGYIIPSEKPDTIADGLLTSLCDKTFKIIQNFVDEIVLVSEEDILKAMKYTYERMKIVIEPSAAVPLGALLANKLNVKGKNAGIILSGGNIDFSDFFDTLKR